MEEFITDDDLFGLLDDLEEVDVEDDDAEMEASNRRYQEIIRKYQGD